MKMRRLIPQPAVSLVVFGTWLSVQNSLTAGDVAGGAIVALIVPLLTARFWPDYPATVRYWPLMRLLARVLFDIGVANFRVFVLVLGPRHRLKPRFIRIPLELEHGHAITLLASIISLTPGTVSANLSGDRRSLLVHGLAIDDPEALIAQIKRRYEAPVRLVFEC